MLEYGVLLSTILIATGLSMIIYNQELNIILFLIAFEILLLSVAFVFVIVAFYYDDFTGNILTILLIPIAGCESAIGLALIIKFNPDIIKNKRTITI